MIAQNELRASASWVGAICRPSGVIIPASRRASKVERILGDGICGSRITQSPEATGTVNSNSLEKGSRQALQ